MAALGDRLQAYTSAGNPHSRVSEAFFTASLLFCVGPLTGVLIIGISLKLLDLKDVKVGNFLRALVIAPGLVGLVSAVS